MTYRKHEKYLQAILELVEDIISSELEDYDMDDVEHYCEHLMDAIDDYVEERNTEYEDPYKYLGLSRKDFF